MKSRLPETEQNMDDVRHRVRFLPDSTEFAVISFEKFDLENYKNKDHHIASQHMALIVNESHTGCSLVVLKRDTDTGSFFEPESKCVAIIGKLAPLQAQVRWRKKIDDVIYRVGIELID